MFKKVTVGVTEEQATFLKSNGDMSKTIRKAIDQYSKKLNFHVELYRSSTSGYAYLDFRARDLEDALEQAMQARLRVNQKEILKDNFWFLKEIKQNKEVM